MSADSDGAAAAAPVNCGELLDALSTGLLVLDAEFRLVYANVGAQDLLALSLRHSRGRPVGELFADPQPLIELLRRSLSNAETCAGHEYSLTPISALQAARPPALLDITVTRFESPLTGTQLLLELADARARQRIARESELLSRADGSRLMVPRLRVQALPPAVTRHPAAGEAAEMLDRHQTAVQELARGTVDVALEVAPGDEHGAAGLQRGAEAGQAAGSRSNRRVDRAGSRAACPRLHGDAALG